MDFTEASNITTAWYEKVGNKELDLRWSPFSVGDFWDKSIDEFMRMHQYDFNLNDNHIIKSYINKKLNRDNKWILLIYFLKQY